MEEYFKILNQVKEELKTSGDIHGIDNIQTVIEAIEQLEKEYNKMDYLYKKAINCGNIDARKRIELENNVNLAKKLINDIQNSCNGANLGDLQLILDTLEGW